MRMKKISTISLLLLFAIVTFATEAIPTSFPRKHLIEHFTGEACGYCPYGMESIEEYVTNNPNCVWVSHHAGYADDSFTIKGSKTLVSTFGVTGAPSVILDRTAQTYVDQSTGRKTSTLVIHPAYLSELLSDPVDTTYASVAIQPTFDAASRTLNVVVDGLVADTTVKELMLTVLIKENGLISKQSDYLYSWDGWTEFRHNKVVRTFLTATLGDKVTVNNQHYTASFSTTLNANWKADSCVLVAYITPKTNQPAINAEQTPIIEGTTGGEELKSEGITMKEVPATFPEEGAPVTDVVFNQIYTEAGTLNNGVPYLGIQLLSTSTVSYQGYKEYPLAILYLIGYSKLTAGTYPLEYTFKANTAISGEKFEEEFALDGSMLYYAYSDGQYLYPDAQWLLHEGTITVGSNGSIVIDATTLNGSPFNGTYGKSSAIESMESASKATSQKEIRNGQLILINADGKEVNVLGTRIK